MWFDEGEHGIGAGRGIQQPSGAERRALPWISNRGEPCPSGTPAVNCRLNPDRASEKHARIA